MNSNQISLLKKRKSQNAVQIQNLKRVFQMKKHTIITIIFTIISFHDAAGDKCQLLNKSQSCFQTCLAKPSAVLSNSMASTACNSSGKSSGVCSEYCSAECNNIEQKCKEGSKKVSAGDEKFGKCIEGDCKNGEGKMRLPKGQMYSGSFKNGKFDGEGEFLSPQGAVYKGSFKNSMYNGYGEFQLKTGDIYKGEWKDDNFTKGTWFLTDGMIISGTFLKGEMMLHGYGEITDAQGNIFKGEFFEGKEHGKGTVLDKDGNVLREGIWSNGKFKGPAKRK